MNIDLNLNNRIKYIATVLLATVIALLILLQNSCNKVNGLTNIITQSEDSLHQTVNKLGQQLTTTTELSGTVEDLKKLNSQKDSSLKKLQELVDKHTASATIINTKTSSNTTGKTTTTIDPKATVIKHDTIHHIDSIFVYPTYKTNYKTAWDSVSGIATKDSFKINYTVYNEFDLKKEWVNKGIFKPRVLEIQVLNKNPKTVTLNLKSFTETEPKRRHWIDWTIGAVAGSIVMYYLRK